MKLISTQRHIDHEIVALKASVNDYDVQAVKIFIDGEEVFYIVDGHHSLFAAIESGVNPSITINQDIQQEADAMPLDDFLESHWIDSEPYDIMTGENVF